MEILITIPCLKDPGGVASYYNSLLPHINENGNFHITTFEIGSTASRSCFFHPIKDQLKYIKKIASKKFDVVHLNPSLNTKSFFRDGLFLLWARKLKVPVIVFFHGWDDAFYSRLRGPYKFFFNLTYLKASRFIVLASDFKPKLIKKGVHQKIHLLSTAVDETLLSTFSINTKIERIKNSLPINILFLSRLEKEKGVFETIDAAKLLIKKGYDVRLSIAGDGGARQEVENYIPQNNLENNVVTLGYVKGHQKQNVFNEHDIYCFPTYHGEGMPTSVLEAVAFGMPVVTRPVGGIKDFFINGKMGYLSQSTKPEEIAECLKKLVSDKQHICDIASYNYEYAKYHFMASEVAKALIDIYTLNTSSK